MKQMNHLKALKIIHWISLFCIILVSIFSLVNTLAGRFVFNELVLFPLLIVGIVGIVAGFIYVAKLPTNDEDEGDEDKKEQE